MLDTTRDFLDRVSRSGLVGRDELDRAFSENTHLSSSTNVDQAAQFLVDQGRLTAWQAGRLKDGIDRGLFIGSYEVLEPIGRGGMGEVYKARHRHLDRIVALKTVLRTDTDDAERVARFRREMRVLERLDHPHIVRVFDGGSYDGTWYLAMEYVEGEDLGSYYKRKGELSVQEVIDYIAQAAEGLEYAHQQGIIHRDIKPANLMRLSDGRIKILDLGLARVLEDGLDGQSIEQVTADRQFLGTPGFISPEQIEDCARADERSDIYSLGCSLYWLLTGQLLFRGGTATERLSMILSGTPPSLKVVRPDAPPDLENVYQRMVAREAGERWLTMREVVAAFRDCAQPDLASTIAGPPARRSVGVRLHGPIWRNVSRRRRITVSMMVAGVVFALAAGTGFRRLGELTVVEPERVLNFDEDYVNEAKWGRRGRQHGVQFIERIKAGHITTPTCRLDDKRTYDVIARVSENSQASFRVTFKYGKERAVTVRIDERGAIFLEGELFDEQSHLDDLTSFGPLLRRAKPAGAFNNLRCAIDGNEIDLYVNGASLGDRIECGDRPNRLLLGIKTDDDERARVEFERVVVWPTVDQELIPPYESERTTNN